MHHQEWAGSASQQGDHSAGHVLLRSPTAHSPIPQPPEPSTHSAVPSFRHLPRRRPTATARTGICVTHPTICATPAASAHRAASLWRPPAAGVQGTRPPPGCLQTPACTIPQGRLQQKHATKMHVSPHTESGSHSYSTGQQAPALVGHATHGAAPLQGPTRRASNRPALVEVRQTIRLCTCCHARRALGGPRRSDSNAAFAAAGQ
jgi:hypothetical protein